MADQIIVDRFTGVKDVDLLILNQLNDTDILNMCKVNQYISGLCNIEELWKTRFSSKSSLERKPSNLTWKQWYFQNFIYKAQVLQLKSDQSLTKQQKEDLRNGDILVYQSDDLRRLTWFEYVLKAKNIKEKGREKNEYVPFEIEEILLNGLNYGFSFPAEWETYKLIFKYGVDYYSNLYRFLKDYYRPDVRKIILVYEMPYNKNIDIYDQQGTEKQYMSTQYVYIHTGDLDVDLNLKQTYKITINEDGVKKNYILKDVFIRGYLDINTSSNSF